MRALALCLVLCWPAGVQPAVAARAVGVARGVDGAVGAAAGAAWQRSGYRAADGSSVRRPHRYRRHPNAGTHVSYWCRDGSASFAHNAHGACSHHGGIDHPG